MYDEFSEIKLILTLNDYMPASPRNKLQIVFKTFDIV